jgi:hypothetical protein
MSTVFSFFVTQSTSQILLNKNTFLNVAKLQEVKSAKVMTFAVP